MGRIPEAGVAGAIAALAALRVLIFAAAFPFFTTIDEHWHVDMVLKYARGYVPRPVSDDYEPETAVLFATWATPEYHMRPEVRDREGVYPPGWQLPRADLELQIAEMRAYFGKLRNLEAYQPPVYYLLVAGWRAAGRAFGLDGGRLLYWLRAFNAAIYFAFVLAAYAFLRREYPANRLVRLGVPALLAVLPQDALYYVTPDALQPLLFGAGFALAVRIARRPDCSVGVYLAAGLVAAAGVLTKYTNAALLVPYALCSAWAVARRPGRLAPRALGARLLLLWLTLVLPVALWCARNQLLFDDPTATSVKIERLNWTPKPLAELTDHPLFGIAGVLEFGAHLAATFWRGELAWHRSTLSHPGADRFYALSSLVLLTLACAGLAARRDGERSRLAEGAALAGVASCVGTLAFLSLLWSFPRLGNPSSALPYFVQGRLVSGALLPFALLYVRGLQLAARPLPARARSGACWAALAAVTSVVVVSEIALNAPVFTSAYNWYHLR